ncbi:Facilitated glucose transporter [Mycena chlorophos]|uniref:Facilitated glucose transporter n=1 Tax=Mycena chlorophos TaxID=658473 RepID=A0A8H6W8U3_MYCCL|nr:Facilitated glucose transporter [Mycena chlorophos]
MDPSQSERDGRDNDRDATEPDSELDTAVASQHTTPSLPVEANKAEPGGATALQTPQTPPNSPVPAVGPSPSTPRTFPPHGMSQFGTDPKVTLRSGHPLYRQMQEHTAQGLADFPDGTREFFDRWMDLGEGRSPPTIAELEKMLDGATAQFNDILEVLRLDPKGPESRLYIPLVRWFSALVVKFEDHERPEFACLADHQVPNLHPTDHLSKPDIVAARPGKKVSEARHRRWFLIPCAGENKKKDFLMIYAPNATVARRIAQFAIQDGKKDFLQLIANARRIMMEGLFCFVFVISIFETDARICRVDRSGCLVSDAFTYTKNPVVFAEFFWRLFKGLGNGRILGEDLTVSVPTRRELFDMTRVLADVLERTGGDDEVSKRRSLRIAENKTQESDPDPAFVNSRWVKVRIDNVVRRVLTIGYPIFRSTATYGRGTRVDAVILENPTEEEKRIYVLKDAWPQACRLSEVVFYQLIRDGVESSATAGELDALGGYAGLARLKGSYDLGDDEHLAAAGHRTVAAQRRDGVHPERERVHRRILTEELGVRLEELVSIKDVVQVLNEAVYGHFLAYKAGVVHRDVSAGNVLARFEPGRIGGFLHDFDYSSLTSVGKERLKTLFPHIKLSDLPKNQKDLTASRVPGGTFQFLAIDLLSAAADKREITHSVHHDLESFFWILVWIVLRQVTCAADEKTAQHLFDQNFDNLDNAAVVKSSWLARRFIEKKKIVPANEPLSDLIIALAEVFHYSHTAAHTAVTVPVYATHQMVLRCFEDALAKPGWPTKDMRPFEFGPIPTEQSPAVASKKRRQGSRFASPGATHYSSIWNDDTGSGYQSFSALAAPLAAPSQQEGESNPVLAARSDSADAERHPANSNEDVHLARSDSSGRSLPPLYSPTASALPPSAYPEYRSRGSVGSSGSQKRKRDHTDSAGDPIAGPSRLGDVRSDSDLVADLMAKRRRRDEAVGQRKVAGRAAQLAKLEQRRLENQAILEKARREAEELEREAALLEMEEDTEDASDPDSALGAV